MRVHRSYIIALSKIDTVEENMISISNNNIPVADSYKAGFLKKINLL